MFAQRPKVGLVLSGGGAKGIAHIGILQAIDSAGLKIDYLTGTSMGSIVGGLYAVGYSGKDIDKIATDLNWDVILSNKIDYRNLSVEEKDEYGNYSVEVGLKKLKPQIPAGLIESEELWLKLNELFLPVYNIKDFSKFNIPFKCVAADLSDGQAVVLENGEIVNALRSSMAIPSVFTTVNYKNTKLVDGGIVRNFPVSDAVSMGADILIGVSLSGRETDVSELNNALDVLYRITQYRDAENMVEQKKLCNLLIEPPIGDYSAGSFGSVKEIMKIGKESGQKYYAYFKRLADSLNNLYPIKYDPLNRLPKTESIVIDSITFEGLENTSRSFLIDKLQITPGQTYTAEEINRGFRKAYSSRYYQKVYYHLKPTTGGHAVLHCIVKEELMAQVKAALSYHSFLGPGLIFNTTIRNLLFDKSRTLAKLYISENPAFLLEHNQAFGRKGNSFINLSFLKENFPYHVYDGKNKTAAYDADNLVTDVNLERIIGTNWSIALGTNFNKKNFSPDVANYEMAKGNSRNFLSYLKASAITTNKPYYPTQGSIFSAEAGIAYHRKADIEIYDSEGNVTDVSNLINEQPAYFKLNLNYEGFIPASLKFVFLYQLQAGLCINSQSFTFDNFNVGGIQRIAKNQIVFPGLNETQINTASIGTALLGFQYNLTGNIYILGRANTGIYDFTTEQKFFDTGAIKFVNGFSLGAAYNLSFLPIEYNAMWSPEIGAFYNHVKIGFLF